MENKVERVKVAANLLHVVESLLGQIDGEDEYIKKIRKDVTKTAKKLEADQQSVVFSHDSNNEIIDILNHYVNLIEVPAEKWLVKNLIDEVQRGPVSVQSRQLIRHIINERYPTEMKMRKHKEFYEQAFSDTFKSTYKIGLPIFKTKSKSH